MTRELTGTTAPMRHARGWPGRRCRHGPALALAGTLAIGLLATQAGGIVAAAASAGGVSSAGMGHLGGEIQADNRDCPPRGSLQRALSVPSAPGAASCAPTGAGPATGYPPALPLNAPGSRREAGDKSGAKPADAARSGDRVDAGTSQDQRQSAARDASR